MAVVERVLDKKKLLVRERISFCRLFLPKISAMTITDERDFLSEAYCTVLLVMFGGINVTGHLKIMYCITLHCFASYCIAFS